MNSLSKAPVIECYQLSKSFEDAGAELKVLHNIDFTLGRGESAAIIGCSGCGKSTFLQLLGGLDTPTTGTVKIEQQDVSLLNEREKSHLRNHTLGFIYQMHHLLPELSALENVAMPWWIRGESGRRARQEAQAILTMVGLKDRQNHKPAELSGGERQRVAVARAMVTRPTCVLADEPTGSLDNKTAKDVYEVMVELKKTYDTSFVVVTHDTSLARHLDRVYSLDGGRLSLTQG